MHTLVTDISPWFMTAALGLLFLVRSGLWQSRRHDCHS